MPNIFIRSSKFLKEFYLRLKYDFHEENPIFIVGCGHSGTTLMLRILSDHKNLYGIDYESKAMQGNYAKFSKILQWRKETEKNGKDRWIEKTPKHIKYIGRILSIFPNANIIVMQRDGRDVVVSIRKRFGDSKLGVNRWIEDNLASLKFKDDERVHFVKLEDLTENPEQVLRKVCNKINLEFYPDLLNYHSSQFTFDNQKPTKTSERAGKDHIKNRVWQVNQPIIKNTSKWKIEATSQEREIFESNYSFRNVMKLIGYSI